MKLGGPAPDTTAFGEEADDANPARSVTGKGLDLPSAAQIKRMEQELEAVKHIPDEELEQNLLKSWQIAPTPETRKRIEFYVRMRGIRAPWDILNSKKAPLPGMMKLGGPSVEEPYTGQDKPQQFSDEQPLPTRDGRMPTRHEQHRQEIDKLRPPNFEIGQRVSSNVEDMRAVSEEMVAREREAMRPAIDFFLPRAIEQMRKEGKSPEEMLKILKERVPGEDWTLERIQKHLPDQRMYFRGSPKDEENDPELTAGDLRSLGTTGGLGTNDIKGEGGLPRPPREGEPQTPGLEKLKDVPDEQLKRVIDAIWQASPTEHMRRTIEDAIKGRSIKAPWEK
jgi:hypothetical protein